MKKAQFSSSPKAFTLVEVVLAIGVIAIAIMALLGLIGPTLNQVRNVIDSSQAIAAMSKFNVYIDETLTFDELFGKIGGGSADYYVYDRIVTQNNIDGIETVVTDNLGNVNADYGNRIISGSVYRFILSRSSMWEVTVAEGGNPEDTVSNWDNIDEFAYFPVFVRVLLLQPESGQYVASANEEEIERDTILTYTTAKLR